MLEPESRAIICRVPFLNSTGNPSEIRFLKNGWLCLLAAPSHERARSAGQLRSRWFLFGQGQGRTEACSVDSNKQEVPGGGRTSDPMHQLVNKPRTTTHDDGFGICMDAT